MICAMFGSAAVPFGFVSTGGWAVLLTALSSASDEFASDTVLFVLFFPPPAPSFPLLIQLPIVVVVVVVGR